MSISAVIDFIIISEYMLIITVRHCVRSKEEALLPPKKTHYPSSKTEGFFFFGSLKNIFFFFFTLKGSSMHVAFFVCTANVCMWQTAHKVQMGVSYRERMGNFYKDSSGSVFPMLFDYQLSD